MGKILLKQDLKLISLTIGLVTHLGAQALNITSYEHPKGDPKSATNKPSENMKKTGPEKTITKPLFSEKDLPLIYDNLNEDLRIAASEISEFYVQKRLQYLSQFPELSKQYPDIQEHEFEEALKGSKEASETARLAIELIIRDKLSWNPRGLVNPENLATVMAARSGSTKDLLAYVALRIKAMNAGASYLSKTCQRSNEKILAFLANQTDNSNPEVNEELEKVKKAYRDANAGVPSCKGDTCFSRATQMCVELMNASAKLESAESYLSTAAEKIETIKSNTDLHERTNKDLQDTLEEVRKDFAPHQ